MATDYSSEDFQDSSDQDVRVQDLYCTVDGNDRSMVRLRCFDDCGYEQVAYYFHPDTAEALADSIKRAALSANQRNIRLGQ